MKPDVSLWIAFTGGLAAFMSPCILPMIPTYLFYLAGEGARQRSSASPAGRERGARRDLMVKAALFVVGFTGVFILSGAVVGAVGAFLFRWRRVMLYLAGAIVIAFGAFTLILPILERHQTLFRRASWLFRLFRTASPSLGPTRRGTRMGALTMGIAFSLAWGPCAGPVAGSIAAYASVWGDVSGAIVLLLAFSLGLAIPFLLSALFVDRLTAGLKRIYRLTVVIRVVSGMLLVILGLLVFTDSLWKIGIAFI
jgi:cytochrome c-type biogenesis protein